MPHLHHSCFPQVSHVATVKSAMAVDHLAWEPARPTLWSTIEKYLKFEPDAPGVTLNIRHLKHLLGNGVRTAGLQWPRRLLQVPSRRGRLQKPAVPQLSEGSVRKFEQLSAASSIPSSQRAFCPQPGKQKLTFMTDQISISIQAVHQFHA